MIAAAAEKGRDVVVAGEVAKIRFPKGGSLSLIAAKLFVQLLERAAADVVNDREHRTRLESLNWAHRDLEGIKDAVRELMTTEISLTVETPRGRRELLGMILAHVDRPAERYAGGARVGVLEDVPGRREALASLGRNQRSGGAGHGMQVLALAVPAMRAPRRQGEGGARVGPGGPCANALALHRQACTGGRISNVGFWSPPWRR